MNRTPMLIAGSIAIAAASSFVGVQIATGATSADETVFVPVAPCRLVDTRPGTNVGPVVAPIGAGQDATFGAWGTDDADSACDVPTTATAIATNATAVNATERTFVTLYPADVANPGTSNLNVEAGSAPTPNSATIPLSTTGAFNVFNNAGTVNVVIDVVGYFQPSTAVGSPGPQGPQGPPGGIDTGHSVSTIGMGGDVGRHSSMVLGVNGNPIISYYDDSDGDLDVAACDDPDCSTATVTSVDRDGDVGAHTSIAIADSGNAVISYYDATNSAVKVAVCGDPSCTTAALTTVETVGGYGSFGQSTSIAVGVSGQPVMSYFDAIGQRLRVATCGDSVCSTVTATTVDDDGFAGADSSITIGADGNPVIAYNEADNGDLRVAACSNPSCSAVVITTVDDEGVLCCGNSQGFVGSNTSITIGTDGNPVVSHSDLVNGDVRLAACLDPSCTTATVTPVADSGFVEGATSITIGTDGNPVVAYYDQNSAQPSLARCETPRCTAVTVTNIETGRSNSSVTVDASLTIGLDGRPVIAYYEADLDGLTVVACGNTTCAPYDPRNR